MYRLTVQGAVGSRNGGSPVVKLTDSGVVTGDVAMDMMPVVGWVVVNSKSVGVG